MMNLTKFLAIATPVLLATAAYAQNRELPIWPGKAPGSEAWTQKEIHTPESSNSATWQSVYNVVTPTVVVFPAEHSKANGTGIIICPGGGYENLGWQAETLLAHWLTERGVTAFILKYRLMRTPADRKAAETDPANRKSNADDKQAVFHLAVADGVQAMKFVRQHAAEFGIDSDRIGIMGSSAGGDVAMGAALDYDSSSRPSFAAMLYGGFSRDVPPPADAPPIFFAVAQNDPYGFAMTGEEVSSWWHKAHHSAELHIYAAGGHGFGIRKSGLPCDHWAGEFANWLEWLGMLKPKSESKR